MPAAGRADVELAIGHQRTATDDRAEELLWLADRLAGVLVEGINLRAVVDEVDPLPERHRHRPAVHHPLLLPLHRHLCDVGVRAGGAGRSCRSTSCRGRWSGWSGWSRWRDCRGVEGSHRSHRRVVEILLGLRHVDRRPLDKRRHVEAAAGELEVPHGLAGARLEVPHAPVARAEDECRLTAEIGDRGGGVGGVFGELLGAVHPPHLAGLCVHPEEAVGRAGGVTPAGDDGAGDDEVFEDHRDVRAATVGGEEAKLLMEGAVPLRLAGDGIDRREGAADAVGEDRLRRPIGDHRRPADAFRGNVGKIDVEDVLPDLFPRHRIEADDLLGFLGRARLVADEGVEPAVEDHRRRDPPRLLARPEDVGPLLGVEGIDVAGAGGVAVGAGPAPIWPLVAPRSGGGNNDADDWEEEGDELPNEVAGKGAVG